MVTESKQLNAGSIAILRWTGYSLLIFAAIDLLVVIYPPDFLNPSWEFRTIGQIVERVPVPLIGFGFAFLGDPNDWKLPERLLLKVLSFLSLAIAAAFFFMVPLGIVDTVRLNNQLKEGISTRVEQGIVQLDQVEDAIGQVEDENLGQLARRFRLEDLADDNPQEIRSELLGRVDQAKLRLERQANISRSQQRRTLLENAFKWNTGAFLSCLMFAFIFVKTDRIRQLPINPKKKKKKAAAPDAQS